MNTELAMIPPAKPIIGQEERDAVDRVLASGMVAQGPEVKAFEEEFGIEIPDEAAEKIKTVQDVVSYIDQNK